MDETTIGYVFKLLSVQQLVLNRVPRFNKLLWIQSCFGREQRLLDCFGEFTKLC